VAHQEPADRGADKGGHDEHDDQRHLHFLCEKVHGDTRGVGEHEGNQQDGQDPADNEPDLAAAVAVTVASFRSLVHGCLSTRVRRGRR